MTKLERARDATLVKYDGFLEAALYEDLGDINTGTRDCAFCCETLGCCCLRPDCLVCPINLIEPPWGIVGTEGCMPILSDLQNMIYNGHAVPAILAAMIYLWGFED